MALLGGGPAEGGGVTPPEKRVCGPPFPGSTMKKDWYGKSHWAPMDSITVPSFPIKLGRWNPSAYAALSTTETHLLVLGALFQEMNDNDSVKGELQRRTDGAPSVFT